MIPDFLIRPLLYGVLALSLVGGAYAKGRIDEQHKHEIAALNGKLKSYTIVQQVVTKYVEKIKLVNRDVPTVHARFVGLCNDVLDAGRDPGGTAPADAKNPPAPGTDKGEQYAREDIAIVDAVDQCDSLIEAINALRK